MGVASGLDVLVASARACVPVSAGGWSGRSWQILFYLFFSPFFSFFQYFIFRCSDPDASASMDLPDYDDPSLLRVIASNPMVLAIRDRVYRLFSDVRCQFLVAVAGRRGGLFFFFFFFFCCFCLCCGHFHSHNHKSFFFPLPFFSPLRPEPRNSRVLRIEAAKRPTPRARRAPTGMCCARGSTSPLCWSSALAAFSR